MAQCILTMIGECLLSIYYNGIREEDYQMPSFTWYEPRKKTTSLEPRITISQQFIALNKALIEERFKDTDRVRIGYDKEENKMILVPLKRDDKKGLKIIENEKSSSMYINGGRLFRGFGLTGADLKVLPEYRGEYSCSWDVANKGVLVDLKNGKVK